MWTGRDFKTKRLSERERERLSNGKNSAEFVSLFSALYLQ